MRRYLLITITSLLMLMLGCENRLVLPTKSNRIVRDINGNVITVPAPDDIHRVAVVHTPVAQIAYIVGVQDKLCAVTTQVKRWSFISRFDPGIQKVSTPVSGWEVNVEELLASRPDICIGSKMQLSKIEKSTTLPLLYVGERGHGSDSIYQKELVRFWGDVFGKKERAENYCRFLDQSDAEIAARVASVAHDAKPRVLIASEQDRSGTYGDGSYMQEWLERAGCRNAAETLQPPGSPHMFIKVSPEQMHAWDPDIILVSDGTLKDLEKDRVWAKFRAVKSKKVYRIPVGVFIWNRPTAEGSALFPLWMAATAYPDLFSDRSPEIHVKHFWHDILKYDLNDQDVYEILHPAERFS